MFAVRCRICGVCLRISKQLVVIDKPCLPVIDKPLHGGQQEVATASRIHAPRDFEAIPQ